MRQLICLGLVEDPEFRHVSPSSQEMIPMYRLIDMLALNGYDPSPEVKSFTSGSDMCSGVRRRTSSGIGEKTRIRLDRRRPLWPDERSLSRGVGHGPLRGHHGVLPHH